LLTIQEVPVFKGSNNTFLGANTALAPGQLYLSGSIALGEGVVVTGFNQLMVASKVNSFNISGLTQVQILRELV